MRLLVTGGRGQLGRAIAARGGNGVHAIGTDELDICDVAQVCRALTTFDPEAVINCAAYTKVDRAEVEAVLAHEVNHRGAEVVAVACQERRIPLVHVSTDYVFSGVSQHPYDEADPIAPIGVYGNSKALGEGAVHAAGGIVVRTSWLFGEGGPSFIHTIGRLALERPVLRVVADQWGRPTYAGDLADTLLDIVSRATARKPLAATYHYCNEGTVTWHGFASAIVEALRQLAPTAVVCQRIDPITTAEYPTLSKRPAYSVLGTSRIEALGVVPPSWRAGMQQVVAEVARSIATP